MGECIDDDLESLGIKATIVDYSYPNMLLPYKPYGAIIFESKEDLNLYRIIGKAKESDDIEFRFLDEFLRIVE